MPKINPSATKVSISPTNAIKQRVQALKSQGTKVIRFDTIETNLNTPENIKKATINAVLNNFTKYTQYSGINDLKIAIKNMLISKYNLNYAIEEILVSCGSKHAIFNAVYTTTPPKSEAIVFAPYWTTYSEQIRMNYAKPVIINTKEKNRFLPTRSEIESAITKNTTAIVINSPCNPTGVVYGQKTLEMISAISLKKDKWIISDEAMSSLVFKPYKHIPIASVNKKTKDRTITIGSFSKNYSMSGFRIGFACAPKSIITAMSNLQAQQTANPVSFSQIAALEALNNSNKYVKRLVNQLGDRKRLMEEYLKKIPRISNITAQGAVFLFPNFSLYLGKKFEGKTITTTSDLCSLFLDNGVATAPGDLFGEVYKGYIRLSYASATTKEVKKGMEIINQTLARLM